MLALLLPLLGFLPVAASASRTTVVVADRDTTLIEDPMGALANGSGPALFTGRTSSAGVRRVLLHFDVASVIPRNALVDEARLTLHSTGGQPGARAIRVHRVLAGWGEGASASGGGQGAPAAPGDATWLHTHFDTSFWVHPGGDFLPRVGATTVVDAPGTYTWGPTNHLVQDVRLWLRVPTRNFGWLLTGDEATAGSTKRFDSRESAGVLLRPRLEVTWRLPGREASSRDSPSGGSSTVPDAPGSPSPSPRIPEPRQAASRAPGFVDTVP